MGIKGLAISQDPHHCPVPKLQEGRQEEILMGDKDWRLPEGPPAPPCGSQATRREIKGDYAGSETRGHHDGRQEHAFAQKGDKRRF